LEIRRAHPLTKDIGRKREQGSSTRNRF
jgi:hypothetical protein